MTTGADVALALLLAIVIYLAAFAFAGGDATRHHRPPRGPQRPPTDRRRL